MSVYLNCDASINATLAATLLTIDVTRERMRKTAIAFEYNNDFGKYLDARMKHFNGNGLAGEAVTAVQGKLDAVKGVMVQNIEVSVRGSKRCSRFACVLASTIPRSFRYIISFFRLE